MSRWTNHKTIFLDISDYQDFVSKINFKKLSQAGFSKRWTVSIHTLAKETKLVDTQISEFDYWGKQTILAISGNFERSGFCCKEEKRHFFTRTVCPSLKRSIETLVKKVKPAVLDKKIFGNRDISINMGHFSPLPLYQNARNRSNIFWIKLFLKNVFELKLHEESELGFLRTSELQQ